MALLSHAITLNSYIACSCQHVTHTTLRTIPHYLNYQRRQEEPGFRPIPSHQFGSKTVHITGPDTIMGNIWRSQRLIFRPVETSDEQFLESMNQYGSDSFQNATHRLPVPQGKAGASGYREVLQGALLGCIICLPGPAKPDVTTTNGNAAVPETIPIGTIALPAVDPQRSHHRNTSVAVSIAHPYQSQGYGGEAILWVLEWAFQHANLHRVSIGAFAFNEGAVRLYQRLGFVLEGRTREAAWHNGKYHDTIEMGMLRDEWRELYGKTTT